MNLKGRLEKLEALQPTANTAYCLVVHDAGRDVGDVRAEAFAAYEQVHGCQPDADRVLDLTFISPETKRCVCGCDTEEIEQ